MTTPDQIHARQALAAEIATQLVALEHTLDSATVLNAGLVATVAGGRAQAGLGLNVAAAAVTELSQATLALAQARQTIARAHAELAAVSRKFGLDESRMIFGGDKDPSAASLIEATEPALRRVA
jgi:hypothetical protein